VQTFSRHVHSHFGWFFCLSVYARRAFGKFLACRKLKARFTIVCTRGLSFCVVNASRHAHDSVILASIGPVSPVPNEQRRVFVTPHGFFPRSPTESCKPKSSRAVVRLGLLQRLRSAAGHSRSVPVQEFLIVGPTLMTGMVRNRRVALPAGGAPPRSRCTFRREPGATISGWMTP